MLEKYSSRMVITKQRFTNKKITVFFAVLHIIWGVA